MLCLLLSVLAAAVPAESPFAAGRSVGPDDAPLDTTDWLPRADLPAPLAMNCAVAASPDLLMVFGGRHANVDPMSDDCAGYLADEDRWVRLAPMNDPRGLAAAAAAGGLVWVTGGCTEFGTGIPDVENYNPLTNSWSEGPRLPQGLHDHAAVSWRDSLVCVIGGGNWSPQSPPTDRVRFLDPVAGAWFWATPLPVPLGAPAAAVLGDTIIVATGWADSGPTNRAWLGLVDSLAPGQLTWREIDTLPGVGRCRASAVAVNGRFYLAGGLLADGRCSRAVFCWDPALETWLYQPDLPAPVADAGPLARLGDWIHVAGGYPGVLPYTDTHLRFYAGRYEADCAAELVVAPHGRLRPQDTVTVTTTVRNHGGAAATAIVSALVTDTISGTHIFTRDTTLFLEAGAALQLESGRFVAPANVVLATAVSIYSPGDQNPDNDTARSLSRTTGFSDPDAYGYFWESTLEPDTVRFAWFDPAGGETLSSWLPDPDNGALRRRLPFYFPWYDVSFDRAWVGTNGYLTLSEIAVGGNLGLPWTGVDQLIAPFWDDLTLRARGSVIETARGDTIAWTWLGVPRFEQPDRTLSFQVLLLADGRVRFNYLDVDADARSSTIGIQGDDGSWYRYLEFALDGRPASRVPRDSVSILFHRPGTGIAEPPQPVRPRGATLNCPSVWRRGPLPVLTDVASSVRVFSSTGRHVRTLEPGAGELVWDLRDARGSPVPAGAYFLRVEGPGIPTARRVAIIR